MTRSPLARRRGRAINADVGKTPAHCPTRGCLLMSFRFGDFGFVCRRVALPLCTALRLDDPACYSRNIDLGRFLMFEPCTRVP